jgi:hypothetical protein
MATYKVTMQLTLVYNFDPQDHPEAFNLGEGLFDPYDKKDVHKFIQEQWRDIGVVDEYTGFWDLNELKVEDDKGT